MGRIRRGGKRIRGPSGGRTRNQECCCCDCEEAGASPTADFSYEQTDHDPCTFSFTDESTPGTCGEIVAWSWKIEGVEFSTAQNPTGVEVEDGAEVSLRVTDSAGCTSGVAAVLVDCCDCDTGGPTADFSYMQTDDDPCCFEFTNSATPGTCGTIVSYLWDFGDGDTSTAEAPTHCYEGAGPWDVTLTVTDEAGCVDSVVGEVECLDAGECLSPGGGEACNSGCLCANGTLPGAVDVTFSGMDGLCSFYNTTYHLPLVTPAAGSYRLINSPGPGLYQEVIEVTVDCLSVTVRLNVRNAGGGANDPHVAWRRTTTSTNPLIDTGDLGVFFNDCSTISATLGDGDELVTDSSCNPQSGVTISVVAA